VKKWRLFILVSITCLVLISALLPMAACSNQPAPTATTPPLTTASKTTTAPPLTTASKTTTAPTGTPASKTIALNAVSYLPKNNAVTHFLQVLIDRVNQRSNGELVIRWVGGPEVIAAADQGVALRKGVIDISLLALGQISEVPEGECLFVQEVTLREARERGLNDFLDKVYRERVNIRYLGRGSVSIGFMLWTKKVVENPKGLAGLKVRSQPHSDTFLRALGAIPVNVAAPDVYSALERGICDALAGDVATAVSAKAYEVTKYVIDHPYYDSIACFLMNVDSWNRLPSNLQGLITGIITDFELEVGPWCLDNEQKEYQLALNGGVKKIKFSDGDAKQFIDLADNTEWGELQKRVSPENYAKLRQLVMK
jgi:TRAP-type C4-dicarboxylate transport system substrate-binding protein